MEKKNRLRGWISLLRGRRDLLVLDVGNRQLRHPLLHTTNQRVAHLLLSLVAQGVRQVSPFHMRCSDRISEPHNPYGRGVPRVLGNLPRIHVVVLVQRHVDGRQVTLVSRAQKVEATLRRVVRLEQVRLAPMEVMFERRRRAHLGSVGTGAACRTSPLPRRRCPSGAPSPRHRRASGMP